MARAGGMCRAQSREMYLKIMESRAANVERARNEAAARAVDPLEVAKTTLRQRGWTVFNQSVLGWNQRNSNLVVVGNTPMEPDEVIAMAERHRIAA